MSFLQSLRFASRTAELGKVARWKPARVQRLVKRRLARLVRHAVTRSPFYREKYRGLGESFSISDLPPTTKSELAQNLQASFTDPRVQVEDIALFMADAANIGRWYLDRYAVSHTSGSQGVPLVIVQDRAALETLFCTMSARSNGSTRPNVFEGWRRLRAPSRIAVVAQHRGFYPSASAFEFMETFTRPFAKPQRFSALDPHLVDELNEFQPNVLVGYASVLESLALDSSGFRLRELKQIANSSEQLSARARQRIESAFGVPVVDHYGIGECLFLSDGCPTDGGAHINSDWAIVENVDDEYQSVPPGEPGSKVLITNLANFVQPFIRYEVPDRIVLASEPCGCGNRLPRIERVEGRSAEAFWVSNARSQHQLLPGVLFHSAMDELHGVREWRAIQTERNAIELQVELFGGTELIYDERALVARLHEFGLPAHVRVSIEQVIGLRPDPRTGKYRRLISEVGPPKRVESLCA